MPHMVHCQCCGSCCWAWHHCGGAGAAEITDFVAPGDMSWTGDTRLAGCVAAADVHMPVDL